MHRQKTIDLLKACLIKHNIKKAEIFGSFARNEETDASDIDLLVELQGHSFFEMLRIETELSDLISKKIDLVEYKAIKKSMTDFVLKKTIKLI